MENGMISVIIPVYNAEKFLYATIQSILAQTYRKFEIIAVNDGSQDRSLAILQQFKDSRICVIDKLNTGVSDTRNIAIKEAKGEFISFLDADDYYSPNYLQRMYETAVKTCADMIVCNYTPFRGRPNFSVKKSVPIPVYSSDILIRAGVLTSLGTKMIKTSILRKYGISFDQNMTFGEDLFFCWKAFLASENVWMIDEKLYGYRMSDGSAISKCHLELYEKYKKAFVDLKTFGKIVCKQEDYTMDVFFATRMPSFILMTVREKSSLFQKRTRILQILNDDTVQKVYEEWDRFVKQINPNQISYYERCRKRHVFSLILSGYKRNISALVKNRICKWL